MKILFINNKTIKIINTILGLILIKISMLLFISFISFIINTRNSKLENALGKIGYIVSNYLLYNGTGISIFLLPILLFFLGLKIYCQYINIKKIILHILFFIFWIPITLSLFCSSKIASGIFGFEIKYFLIYFIGKIGLIFMLLTSKIIYIILVFKITPDQFVLKNVKNFFL